MAKKDILKGLGSLKVKSRIIIDIKANKKLKKLSPEQQSRILEALNQGIDIGDYVSSIKVV